MLVAGQQIYRRRSRECLTSHEGLDQPDVARPVSRVAAFPPMALLRRYVVRRVLAMRPASSRDGAGRCPVLPYDRPAALPPSPTRGAQAALMAPRSAVTIYDSSERTSATGRQNGPWTMYGS